MDFWQAYVVIISTCALIWAMKEVHEMVTVRKMWQRALTDPVYAGQVFANALSGVIENMDNNPAFKTKVLDFLKEITDPMVDRATSNIQGMVEPAIQDMSLTIQKMLADPVYMTTVITGSMNGFLQKMLVDKELETRVLQFFNTAGINMFVAIQAYVKKTATNIVASGTKQFVKLPRNHILKPSEDYINHFLTQQADKVTGDKKESESEEDSETGFV